MRLPLAEKSFCASITIRAFVCIDLCIWIVVLGSARPNPVLVSFKRDGSSNHCIGIIGGEKISQQITATALYPRPLPGLNDIVRESVRGFAGNHETRRSRQYSIR